MPSPELNKIHTQLIASILSGLLWVLARLPGPLRRGVVWLGGTAYAGLARSARRVVLTNISHIEDGLQQRGVTIGSRDQFATDNLRATASLIPETALCWRGPANAWRALIDGVHGEEAQAVLRQASNPSSQKESQGVLLLSPHLGNWELLNMYLGAEFGLTVLYDPPKINALEPLIRRARQQTQSTLLPIGPAGLREMVRRLRRGAVVGMLPDQVPSRQAGVLAEFFGKQALTINLVHRLVRRHQPRVFLVCALRKQSGQFDIHFDELTEALTGVSETEAATAMNQAIEQRISQAPEQYQWSYKRFKRVDAGADNIYRRSGL